MSQEKHVTFIDQIGRNIVGKQVAETETTITIKNPIIVHCQLEQNGQIQVQNFPLFFFEFIHKDHRDKNEWVFNKSNIVQSNVVLNETVLAKYEEINKPQQPVESIANPKVISITDI